jgi:hypothetical protein
MIVALLAAYAPAPPVSPHLPQIAASIVSI